MTAAAIQAKGLGPLARALREAGDEGMTEMLKDAHRDAAEYVADTARPRFPRRSGRLVGTLRTKVTLLSGRVLVGSKRVPYAPPIMFGWPRRNIAPNNVLYDALARSEDTAENLFVGGLLLLAEEINEAASSDG